MSSLYSFVEHVNDRTAFVGFERLRAVMRKVAGDAANSLEAGRRQRVVIILKAGAMQNLVALVY